MKRAVFLDRDGTIIVDKGYLADPEGVELLPRAVEGLRRFQAAGYDLLIVTNQSGVGRGYYSAADAEAVNARTVALLAESGIAITEVLYCPHLPNAGCSCRKPAPGMLLEGAARHGIDLGRSVMIGDTVTDIEAGRAAGCALTFLIAASPVPGAVVVTDLAQAADYVIGYPENSA